MLSLEVLGFREELSNYRLFALTPSKGAMNITSDELFQKTKELVFTTAELSKYKVRDLIEERMSVLYPLHHHITFVWEAGRTCHTEVKDAIAIAKFDAMENKEFGHDILIILH